MLIVGVKSIGKSALLERIKAKMQSSFAIYSVELSEFDAPDIITFFVSMILTLFKQYCTDSEDSESSESNLFSDPLQSEIVKDLIDSKKHPSETSVRSLSIPTIYAEGGNLIDDTIFGDINLIVRDLHNSDNDDLKGLVIIIDEFQQFTKNPRLLEILRMLSKKIDNFSIIGAGLPSIHEEIRIFEKFNRSSIGFTLDPLSEYESREAILKPIQKMLNCSQFESEKLFTRECMAILIERTTGNPYHIRLLCAEAYKYFKNDQNSKYIEINRAVMEAVLDQYGRITDNSTKIKNALGTTNKLEREAFARLYKNEGLNLHTIALSKMAFQNITEEFRQSILTGIYDDLANLRDFALFDIVDLDNKTVKPSELLDYNFTQAAQLKYHFIGDHLDKLYASYYYESLESKKLLPNNFSSYEHIISTKLSLELSNAIIQQKVDNEKLDHKLLMMHKSDIEWDKFEREKSAIEKIYDADIQVLNEKDRAKINKFADKFELGVLALISERFGYRGYYLVIIKLKIRGNTLTLPVYFPFKSKSELTDIIGKVEDYSDYFTASLDEYDIEIIDVEIKIIPNTLNLTIFSVHIIDFENEFFDLVRNYKFEEALNLSNTILETSIRYNKSNETTAPATAINNLGFCLMHLEKLNDATREFNVIGNKFLNSKMANTKTEGAKYIQLRVRSWHNYYKNDFDNAILESKNLLKKISKEDYLYSQIKNDLNIFEQE